MLATDPETGNTRPRQVTDVIVGSGHKQLKRIVVAAKQIVATDEHPFYTAKDHAWTDAADLRQGHQLLAADGTLVAVSALIDADQTTTVYNLTVDADHTYYAGDQPVLVHNAERCDTGTTKAERPASNAVQGRLLKRQLASESQMTGPGSQILGPGTGRELRDAPRLAKEYGGDPTDYAKMSSPRYRDGGGTYDLFGTHWYQNIRTGTRHEFKTKFPRAENAFGGPGG